MSIRSVVPEMPPIETPAEFMIGSTRVCPTASGAFWLHPAGRGRARFVPKDSELAESIRNGQMAITVEVTRRAFAEGTHEPMVYFRDSNGKLGIPPDPSMIPEGCDRYEANSVSAIDSVMKEMNLDHLADFTDEEGAFQEGLDAMVGSPRQYLVERLAQGSMSNLQRDTMRLMISELDAEQRERGKITSETRHHAAGR